MTRICANPNCGKQFEPNKRQIYCCLPCRNKVYNVKQNCNRKIHLAKKAAGITTQPGKFLEWKDDLVRKYHKIKSIEQIAARIKKTPEAVKLFCQLNRLAYIEGEELKEPQYPKRERREQPKPIIRAKPDHTNVFSPNEYYIARLVTY